MSSAQHIDTLLRDPLRGITAAEGATGFVGADVPLELLLATQRPFGHLPWQTERQWPWAARWLESVRSSIFAAIPSKSSGSTKRASMPICGNVCANRL